MTAKKKKTSSKKTSKKKLVPEDPPVKSQPTFETKFTKTELVHLRDLFSVFLPPNGSMTVSESLAKQEGRVVAEKLLFDKIVDLCVKAKIPVGEAAPDHIVGLAENPTLGVFQMTITSEHEDEVETFEKTFGDGGGLFTLNDEDD